MGWQDRKTRIFTALIVDQALLQSLLRSIIRKVHNWPKAGVQFRDITPLFQTPQILSAVITHFVARYQDTKIDAIAGMEARGFIFGAA